MKPAHRSPFSVFLAFVLALAPVTGIYGSPPADNLHHRLPFDYGQWQQERPAAKRLADLDAGEPRTVRMIYFLPSDRPYQPVVVDSMKTMIRQLRTFYSGQMQAHGHGGKPSASRPTARANPWFTASMASTPTATISTTP